MNYRTLVKEIAGRFPDLTQRQVEDVLAVLVEVCRTELSKSDGEIVIRDFGTLSVDVQQVQIKGFIRQRLGSAAPETLKRVYLRFRPTGAFRATIEGGLKEKA